MKQLLLFCLALLFFIGSIAQYTDTSANRRATDYLNKSNRQKTTGWVLLGGGAALTGIGLIIGSVTLWDEVFSGGESKGFDAASILFSAGLISMAGSIPLFIAAGKNRRKAASFISFKIEKATIVNLWHASISRYPAVAIRIRL